MKWSKIIALIPNLMHNHTKKTREKIKKDLNDSKIEKINHITKLDV